MALAGLKAGGVGMGGARPLPVPTSTRPPVAQSSGAAPLMAQQQQRGGAAVVAPAKKRSYKDYGSTDSLDLDSMDGVDGAGSPITKYNSYLAKDGAAATAAGAPAPGAAPAKAAGGAGGGGVKASTAQAQGTKPPPPAPAPAPAATPSRNGQGQAAAGQGSFGAGAPVDAWGFDDEWGATPVPPGGGFSNNSGRAGGGGGGGYFGGGSGGGYMTDATTTRGGNGGGGYYAKPGSGAGGGAGTFTADPYWPAGGSPADGGYYMDSGPFSTAPGGRSGSGYISSGGSYGARSGGQRRGGRSSSNVLLDEISSGRYGGSMDDLNGDVDGESPVPRVDSCVINGRTLQANNGITVKQVYLLGPGPDRNPLGVMSTQAALEAAAEAKQDLLLITPDASPPVARIVDWSKYKYELEKGAKEKKAKAVTSEVKEVRLRPATDSGDLATKVKSCQKFLSKGDRVKLVMKFEGRELQFKEQGKEVLLNFIAELASIAKVEGPLNFKTGTYTIMLMPTK